MTKNFHKTETYDKEHLHFGGIIYSSDYNTDYRRKNNTHGSPIAKHIADDKRFDEQCRKNVLDKQNYRR